MNLFTHKTKPFTVAILILISTAQLSAQESNDLEGWSAVQIDIKATEKLSFSVAEHLRYKNDVSILSTYFTQLETSYEVFKDFELGGGVRFIKKNDNIGKKQGIESHFRYQLDAHYQHAIKQLNISYRLRYQNKNELGFSEDEGDIAKKQLRFMVGVGYKLIPIGVVFKLKGELFSTVSEGSDANKVDRNRFTLMASRKFRSIGKFALFYRVQEDIKTIEENTSKSIIGLKYSYSLDFRKRL
tara:strand:+ start:230 stop:955 length:726 start_codon:yes stop_codon:yes gene_type:complete